MNKQKQIASELGKLLGLSAFYVKRNPVDPNYDRKVADNRLRFTRPIFLYSIEPVEITTTRVDTNANNNRVVTFNENEDMQLSLANVDSIDQVIPEPNNESVKKAIMQAANGGKKMLFTNLAKLVKCVKSLNIDSKAELDRELNDLINFSKTFTTANEIEHTAAEKYLKELGIDPSGIL